MSCGVWSYFPFFLRVCLEETKKVLYANMGIESALSFKQAINGHWSQLPCEISSNRIVLLKWQPNALILKFCSKLTYILKRVTLPEERAQTLKLRASAFTKSETPILMHFPNCIYFSSLVKQVSIGWRRMCAAVSDINALPLRVTHIYIPIKYSTTLPYLFVLKHSCCCKN